MKNVPSSIFYWFGFQSIVVVGSKSTTFDSFLDDDSLMTYVNRQYLDPTTDAGLVRVAN
ncbi:MAG: hypothetical protein ACM3X1_08415 [Ignavibacteriales bacterium]